MATAWIVHLSDLHVGGTVEGGGLLRGLTAHDPAPLEALPLALAAIRRQAAGDPCVLAVSGDASATGAPAQVALYRTLLATGLHLRPEGPPVPALAAGFDRLLDLPGNHDYWDGQLARGHLNPRTPGWFAPAGPVHLPLQRHLVALHPLCSTGGATPGQQVRAVGAFAPADLERARDGMAAAEREAKGLRLPAVHLLLTHHSPSAGSPRLMGLSPRGRRDLVQLCAGRVRGLLTGHAHGRHLEPAGRLPAEVRCGTTLQAAPSLPWPAPQQRSFWLHRLADGAGPLTWTAQAWDYAADRGGARRFVPAGSWAILPAA